MNNFLELHNIKLKYDGSPVVSNVSFIVEEFDCIGLIGPNGSGKSTILKSIGGSLKPLSGSITYKHKDIYSYTAAQLAKERAFVPQFIDMPFPYTVKDFILIGRFPYNGRLSSYSIGDEKIAEEVMGLTDTSYIAEKSVLELSGGERQRVILAQALAQKPKLLLLDEPFTHLDIVHQVQMAHVLQKLIKQKLCTVIIAMHDLTMCSMICNKTGMLNKGKLEVFGKPADICTKKNLSLVFKADFEILNSTNNGTIIMPKISL